MWYDMTDMSTVWLPILLDAAIKGLIVLGLAALVSLSMRRSSASARHLVWFLVLVSLPVLPILSATLPDWGVLPGWVMLPAEVERPVEAAAVESAPPVLVDPSGPIDPVAVVAESAVPTVVPREVHVYESEFPVASAEPIANVVAIEKTSSRAADEPIDVATSIPWQPWALSIWLVGTLLAGLPILAGTASLWWLQRKSKRVGDGPILARLMQLARQMGVRRPVVLLQSARRSMPMQWGLLRPKLLLPDTADDWSAERRQVVLLHELAHIGRHDCLTQLAARIVCALYWFNPMVWIALRQLRLERERACDDLILGTGCKPSNYAEHLLAVASGFRTSRLAGFCAIAMARPSALEGRLLAILNPGQNRRRLSRAVVLLAMATLLCVVVPMAMMRAAEEKTSREIAIENSAAQSGDGTQLPAPIEQLGDPQFPQRKAAEEAKARAEAAAKETEARRGGNEFGPTVERTVVGDVPGGYSLIDFDRDVVFRMPTEFVDGNNAGKFLAWTEQHGVDASIRLGGDTCYAAGMNQVILRTDNARWDSMTLAELRADRILQSAEPGFGNISNRQKDLPATYRLKTRDGGLGMLQVVGMTENPAGVKIRYKMVPRTDKNPIAWGKPVKGLQLGLTFDPQNRAYRVGEVISFEVLARNVGPKSLELADFVGVNPPRDGAALLSWSLTFLDSQGKDRLLSVPDMNPPVLPRLRSLPRGHTMVVGTVSFKNETNAVPHGRTFHLPLTPGTHQVSQHYRFEDRPKATWSGNLSTGQLSLKVINRERRFHGLDLSDEPSTTGPENLPDLFEARPPGSKSYHLRDDVETIYNGIDVTGYVYDGLDVRARGIAYGTVYVTADKKRFYVQHDPLGAGTLHHYGPFTGDPWTKIALATGQVIDSQGKPIAGANVQFRVFNVHSDGNGRFLLPPIEPKLNILATASAPGYATHRDVSIARLADGSYFPDSGKIVLYRAATLLGRVIGPDGKPLSAAPLSLSTDVEYSQPKTHSSYHTANHLRAITAKEGRFRMENVPPGTHMLFYPWEGPVQGEIASGRWKEFIKPGEKHPSAPVEGISGVAIVEVGEGKEVKNVTIDLSRSTCAVEGRVVDADDRPLRGVRIAPTWKDPTAKWLTFSPPKRAYGRIVTDEDGRYEIRNLPPGRWELIAWHDPSKKRTEPEAVELSQGKTTRCDLKFPLTIASEAADE